MGKLISVRDGIQETPRTTTLRFIRSETHQAKHSEKIGWAAIACALRRGADVSLVAAACLAIFQPEARAYADPGSGALLWQVLLSGVFGLLFYLRTFWSRVAGRKGHS